jgi:hypothetical protein
LIGRKDMSWYKFTLQKVESLRDEENVMGEKWTLNAFCIIMFHGSNKLHAKPTNLFLRIL